MTTAARKAIRRAFNPDELADSCSRWDFGAMGFEYQWVKKEPDKWVFLKQQGAKILFVAHLDSVQEKNWARTTFTPDGPIVHSPVLDDRLGVYVGLHLLPKLGVEYDILLTTNEEKGASTAQNFQPKEHEYNWMFQFDRGGTDVVTYMYGTGRNAYDFEGKIKEFNPRVTYGGGSDICKLTHLGIRGMNWGVGYREYHSPRAYAWMNDTFECIQQFVQFYKKYKDEKFEYEPPTYTTTTYKRDKDDHKNGSRPHQYPFDLGYGGYDYSHGGTKETGYNKWVKKYGHDSDKYDEDSLDLQIKMLDKEREDEKLQEVAQVEQLIDQYEPSIEDRNRQAMVIIRKDMGWASKLHFCPQCGEKLMRGICVDCIEDWDDALAFFRRHFNMEQIAGLRASYLADKEEFGQGELIG